MALRTRLTPVLSLIPSYGTIADVGAGDGHLAIARVLRDFAPVIAVERTPATVARLERGVRRIAKVSPYIDVRLGDDFDVIETGEIDGAVIAGIGGRTIAAIIDKSLTNSWQWLIVQCVQHKIAVELAIEKHGLYVETYCEISDNGHTYPVWKLKVGK